MDRVRTANVNVIRFTTSSTEFGQVLLAATQYGVCAVVLGDSAEELETWLCGEYESATIARADGELNSWMDAVRTELAEQSAGERVPLDVPGTAFQHRVWKELRAIPRGETRTYTQVAAAIGSPTAVRAVARACATNPVSVLTPCHRVVGADGSMRGYRWGVARKLALLERERLG